jgi:gluconokinase
MADRGTSATHLVVMGVAGVGKTEVSVLLAERLGWGCAEADAFHPRRNIEKMAAGTPLDDEDRWPWLRQLRDWMSAQAAAGRDTVLSCSALRRAYRDVLREADGRARFVHLAGDLSLVTERLAQRSGHFMPPALLASQYQTLEPLAGDEEGITVAVDAPPDEIVQQVIDWFTRGREQCRQPQHPSVTAAADRAPPMRSRPGTCPP